MRCRKLKKKCTGDPGDGSGCESCRNVSNHRDCIFVRPDTWLLNPDSASAISVCPSTSVSSRWISNTCRQPLLQTRSYRPDSPPQTLQQWHTLPPLRMHPTQQGAALPAPAQSPSTSPRMSLSNSPWPSQPSFQRQLPPGFTDPVFYTSQARIPVRSDYDVPEAGLAPLSPSRSRSYLASRGTGGRSRDLSSVVGFGGPSR